MRHGAYTTIAMYGDDATSLPGSQRLIAQIERYWRERGHEVTVKLRRLPYSATAREAAFALESDMINGLPQQLVKAKAAEQAA